jgi:hypothetical protein
MSDNSNRETNCRDQISVGDISASEAVAVGRGAIAINTTGDVSISYPMQPSPCGLELTLGAVSAELERVSSALSEEKAAKLEEIRELDRKGQVRSAYVRVEALRQEENWKKNIFTNTLKAQILRMLARYALVIDNNADKARALANQARDFDPNADDTSIKTLIRYHIDGAAAALAEIGTVSDISIFNLKLALLLELGRTGDAIAEIQAIPGTLKPNATTEQLYALALLSEGNLPSAQTQIREAVAINPQWEYVRESEAIINYFSALSSAALPRHLVPWPEPLSRLLVKCDDQSLTRLRKAEAEFRELVVQTERSDEQRDLLDVWRLACLANDPDRQNEARDFCRTLLASDPSNSRALLWAILRDYEVDLPTSEKALEASTNTAESDIERIIALVALYLNTGKFKQAIALLERTKSQFESQSGEDLWFFWYVQALLADNNHPEALVASDAVKDSNMQCLIRTAVRREMARLSDNWQPFIEHLEACFQETDNGLYLYECCQFKAHFKDWTYVADRANELIKRIGTPDVLEFAAKCAWQAKRPALCLELLESYQSLFPGGTLSSTLRSLRAYCLERTGLISESVAEAEALVREHDATEHLLVLMDLQLRQGDIRGHAITARRLATREGVAQINLLRAANSVLLEDAALARKLWKRAISGTVDPHVLSEAIDVGYRLNLDRELRPFLQRAQLLAIEGKGPFRAVALRELLSHRQNWIEHLNSVNQNYESGEIPIHLFAEVGKSPLVRIFYDLAQRNCTAPNPQLQPAILARHGSRLLQEALTASSSQWRLHLDISAFLLAAHLDILDAVEEAFKPLRISPALQTALVRQRQMLIHHQPSRLNIYRQILNFLHSGQLRETSSQQDATTEPEELTTMGWQGAALLERAKAENGYIVDFLPLTKMAENGELQPVTLPEPELERVINCRSLLEALKRDGVLPNRAYQEALVKLGSEGSQVPLLSSLPPSNSPVFLSVGIASILAEADLLNRVCCHFQVFIDRDDVDEVRGAVSGHERDLKLVNWLTELIERVRDGLAQGVYEVIALSDKIFDGELEKEENEDFLTALDMFRFTPQSSDTIWIDDRFFNRYFHRDGVPIIGILEILEALRLNNRISEDDYYDKLLQLRKANIRYIPLSSQEIIYHLKQAQVSESEGVVRETDDLAVLRRYIASCLLDSNRLQRPPLPENTPNPQGEIAFLVESLNAVSDALVVAWVDEEVTDPIATAHADWIWENLYVGSLGTQHFLPESDSDSNLFGLIGLDISKAYMRGLGLSEDSSNNEQNSPRRKYFTWLEERISRQRFKADIEAVVASAQVLHYLLDNTRRERGDDAELELANQVILSQLYLELPKQIRAEIKSNPELMSWLGIQTGKSVSVGSVSFTASDFLQAAMEAINGGTGRAVTIEHQVEFTIKQPELDNPSGYTLEVKNEQNSTLYGINDDLMYLLSDNIDQREEVLRSHRDWFDCDKTTFDKVISEIASATDPQYRLEQGKGWREASATFFYASLEQKFCHLKQFNWDELIPPSAEGLLQHFRIDGAIDEGSFPVKLSNSAPALLADEGLEATLERLACLPVKLPAIITEELGKLSSDERQDLLNRLASRWAAPICKLHLIDLALSFISDGEIVIDLAKKTLDELSIETDAIAHFHLSKAILGWVSDEFSYWTEVKEWSVPIKLAMIWTHSSRLHNLFHVAGAQAENLARLFEYHRSQWHTSTDILDRNPQFWNDVFHPCRLSRVWLIVHGLAVALKDKNLDMLAEIGFIDQLRDRTDRVFKEPSESKYILLRDPSLMQDSLKSLLGGDRGKLVTPLFGSELGQESSSGYLKSVTEAAINALDRNLQSQPDWFKLAAVVGDLPIYDELKDKLQSLLAKLNLASLFATNPQTAFLALNLASDQVAYIEDDSTRSRLQEGVVEIAKLLCEQQKEADDNIAVQLLESTLSLSIKLNDPHQTSHTFTNLLERILYAWPSLANTSIYSVVLRFAQALPVRQLHGFWSLVLRLRALRDRE